MLTTRPVVCKIDPRHFPYYLLANFPHLCHFKSIDLFFIKVHKLGYNQYRKDIYFKTPTVKSVALSWLTFPLI